MHISKSPIQIGQRIGMGHFIFRRDGELIIGELRLTRKNTVCRKPQEDIGVIELGEHGY